MQHPCIHNDNLCQHCTSRSNALPLTSLMPTLSWRSSVAYIVCVVRGAACMQVIEVSDEAIVLPLAHQHFLVGLLFIEGSSSPVMPALTDLTAEGLSSSTALSR